MLRGPHRERLDVVPATGDQTRDPGEDSWLVLHQHRERVRTHQASSSRSHSGASPRAYWISSLLVPAATIGHTIASRWTPKSTTTGRSWISMAASIVASTSSGLSQRIPTHP